MMGLLISDDLIFTSKVTATAHATGCQVVVTRSGEQAAVLAAQHQVHAVLVDLHNPGLDLAVLLSQLRSSCSKMPRTIGYGSHVDVTTLKAARAAGCDKVMPRSQFVEELESELANWLTP